MNEHEGLDPAYHVFLDEPASVWTLENLASIRARIGATWKPPEAARHEQHWTSHGDGTPGLRLCVYQSNNKAPLATMLYIHGGGFVLGSPEMVDDELADLASELNIVIVAVDYRLAPEHPFPAPLDDCCVALDWIVSEGRRLGMPTQKVLVMGHSAGGGLAAAVAIRTRERHEHRLAGMVLVYPMLDHRTGSAGSATNNPITGRLSWSREANRFCWQCLQGGDGLDGERAALFSPALATNLKGLPPTFIGVGGLDLFLEEDVAFALRLSQSGVPVELHVYPGVPHLFDQHPGEQTEQLRRDLTQALGRLCQDQASASAGPKNS